MKRTSDGLVDVWGNGQIRAFLSHKSSHKEKVSELKTALDKNCGISAFVAHEDIEPTTDWAKVIRKALRSMDTLVALLTNDFYESKWTDQEAGFAIGRNKPVLAIRLGQDPKGLMGMQQGIGGCKWDNIDMMSVKVFQNLHDYYARKQEVQKMIKLFECALVAYQKSGSFEQSFFVVEYVLSCFKSLHENQLDQIKQAFSKNSQNWCSFRGRDKLCELFHTWTGVNFEVKGNQLIAN